MGFDCVLIQDAAAAAEEDIHDASIRSICGEGGIFGAVSETGAMASALETWM